MVSFIVEEAKDFFQVQVSCDTDSTDGTLPFVEGAEGGAWGFEEGGIFFKDMASFTK